MAKETSGFFERLTGARLMDPDDEDKKAKTPAEPSDDDPKDHDGYDDHDDYDKGHTLDLRPAVFFQMKILHPFQPPRAGSGYIKDYL